MNNKNIEWLKSKMWYRLVKVLYTVSFIFVIGVSVAVITESGLSELNLNETQVVCLLGNRKSFNAAELGIDLYPSYQFKNGFNYRKYFEGSNTYDIKKIFNACSSDGLDYSYNDIFLTQRFTEINHDHEIKDKFQADFYATKVMNDLYLDSEKVKQLTFKTRIFDIKPVFTYKENVSKIILSLVIASILFELVRRVFYYVVLGRFLPKDNN